MSKPVIHAFDPDRHYNSQLMLDCQHLGYLDAVPMLDLTYGKGNFWSLLPDIGVWSNDLDPSLGTHFSEDFTDTPWGDREWGATVLDPPYRMGGTPSTPDFDDAYGINEYRTHAQIRKLIEDGTREACRISSGITMIKVQDHVSSGVVQPQVNWVITAAAPYSKFVDSLHVIGGRPQSDGRKQKRARHGYSTLVVLTRKRPARSKR
jgi:hypothetical protein